MVDAISSEAVKIMGSSPVGVEPSVNKLRGSVGTKRTAEVEVELCVLDLVCFPVVTERKGICEAKSEIDIEEPSDAFVIDDGKEVEKVEVIGCITFDAGRRDATDFAKGAVGKERICEGFMAQCI